VRRGGRTTATRPNGGRLSSRANSRSRLVSGTDHGALRGPAAFPFDFEALCVSRSNFYCNAGGAVPRSCRSPHTIHDHELFLYALVYVPTLNSTQRRGVITVTVYRRDPRRAAEPTAHIILPIPVRSLPYVLHPPSLPSMAPHVLHAVSDVPLCCPLPMRPEAGRASYRPRTGTGLPSPPPRALHTAHAQDITRHDATLRLRASCVQHTQPLHPARLASVHALFRCSAKIELPPCVSLRRSPPSRVAASRMDQW